MCVLFLQNCTYTHKYLFFNQVDATALGAALEPQRAQHAEGLESIDQILSIPDGQELSPALSSAKPQPRETELLEQICAEGEGEGAVRGDGGVGDESQARSGPVHLRVCGVGSAWARQDSSLAAVQQLNNLEACRCVDRKSVV